MGSREVVGALTGEMGGAAGVRLLIADLDGTLVESWRDVLLPGVAECLTELHAQGVLIAAVTNQGGVGYRYAHEHRGELGKAGCYPTLDQALTRLRAIAGALPISRIYTCLYHGRADWPVPPEWADGRIEMRGNIVLTWRPAWRKPAPGMVLRAIDDAGIDPGQVLMIGDRPEDFDAAEATGVAFRWANVHPVTGTRKG